MRLYKKEGNSLQILSSPKDDVEKGDYLLVEDVNVNRKNFSATPQPKSRFTAKTLTLWESHPT